MSPIRELHGDDNTYSSGEDEPFELRQVQVDFWPDNSSIPPQQHMRFFYELLLDVVRMLRRQRQPRQRQQRHGGQEAASANVLIHCLDACGKSGLFLVCCNLLILMMEADVVHVPFCVLKARESLSEIIGDSQQLKFCFDLAKFHWDYQQLFQNF